MTLLVIISLIDSNDFSIYIYIYIKFPWLQDKVRNDEFDIAKIIGEDNLADILAKKIFAELIKKRTRHLESGSTTAERVRCPI